MADYSIYLFHILFVGPLLILIGLYHDNPNFPKIMWKIMIILGFGIIAYHAYMAYKLNKALSSNNK
jgi:hypothetical protein